MKLMIASLVAAGIFWGAADHATAAAVKASPQFDTTLIDAQLFAATPVRSQADEAVQLAGHCGPRGGYYHGGWRHHPRPHHYYRPRGAYYRGAYGPRPYYPPPAYPGFYGGSGFGLYIGF